MSPDDLLLPSDAARILRLSVDSVRVLADAGKLPAMRTVGGRRLFRRSDVSDLAQERAINPPQRGGRPRRGLGPFASE